MTFATPLPIPDQIAMLTRERDEARLMVATLLREQTTQAAALQALAGEYQIALAELRALRDDNQCAQAAVRRLTVRVNELRAELSDADQQHANEPCAFIEPDSVPEPEQPPARIMPATALRRSKQTIGLVW